MPLRVRTGVDRSTRTPSRRHRQGRRRRRLRFRSWRLRAESGSFPSLAGPSIQSAPGPTIGARARDDEDRRPAAIVREGLPDGATTAITSPWTVAPQPSASQRNAGSLRTPLRCARVAIVFQPALQLEDVAGRPAPPRARPSAPRTATSSASRPTRTSGRSQRRGQRKARSDERNAGEPPARLPQHQPKPAGDHQHERERRHGRHAQ